MAGRFWHTLTALALLTGSAQAFSSLPTGQHAPALPAWTEFCAREPAECSVDTSEAAIIQLHPETSELIEAVNAYVNRTITPVTDERHWNVVDHWGFPTDGSGDCEDFQLLKRKLLVEAGLPRRALRITVVLNHLGEGHAVLMVRTDKGDLILDNVRPEVLVWHETGYLFIKRESNARTGWDFFEPIPVLTATADPVQKPASLP